MADQLSDAEVKAYDAAKVVMEDAGMVFPAPWDGDLSDLEREQFDV